MATVPKFEPATPRPRHDGWSAERQIRFVEAIAEGATVDAAARRVGMTRDSAYKLRRRPCGGSFRRGWDAALDCNMPEVEQAVIERVKNGVARPIFYKGEQVGEWRHHDERLTMFLLRSRRPERYGKWIEHFPAPISPNMTKTRRSASTARSPSSSSTARAKRATSPKTMTTRRTRIRRATDSRAHVGP